MRASKIVVSRVTKAKNGQRQANASEVQMKGNIGKMKSPSSPDSNEENISPSLRKRRREKDVVEKEKAASPATPKKGRTGLRNSKPEEIVTQVVESPTKGIENEVKQVKLKTRTKTSVVNVELMHFETPSKRKANAIQSEVTLINSATKNADAMEDELVAVNSNTNNDEISNSFTANTLTPNTSTLSDEIYEADKSDRQLRSSLRNARSIFDTPVKMYNAKPAETMEIDKSEKAYDVENVEDAQNAKGESTVGKIENSEIDNDNIAEICTNVDASEKVLTPLLIAEKDKVIGQESAAANYEDVQVKEEILPSSNNSTLIPIKNIKSPSIDSIDSAKGSSIIGTDSDCTIFFTGDLYWGQIHNFSYWPCMVCPDDTNDNNSITRLVDQSMEIHVRFFADNARHSWVKRENLLRYHGLKHYKEITSEVISKYGEKSPKLKIFFPKKSKKNIWRNAVEEADKILNVSYPERLKAFFDLNNIARERLKEERMRRKSLNEPNPNQNNALMILLDTPTNVGNDTQKRCRSESPPSPVFSPIDRIKRRKTNVDMTEFMITNNTKMEESESGTSTNNVSKASPSQSIVDDNSQLQTVVQKSKRIETPEFEIFYDTIKEFVTSGIECEWIESNLYTAVKNVWSLKCVFDSHVAKSMQQLTMTPNSKYAGNSKRLSIRLKDQQQRQHMQMVTAASIVNSSPTLQVTHPPIEKRRSSSGWKSKIRPMQEVIDDIFNLDKRYLFDNMGRDPVCKYCFKPDGVLKRCSKSCLNWLHKECLNSSNNEVNNKNNAGKSKENFNNNKKRSTIRRNTLNVELSTNIKLPPEILHVTGDDDTADTVKVEEQENLAASNEVKNLLNMDSNKNLEEIKSVNEQEPLIMCKECTNDEKPKCFVCRSDKTIEATPTTTTTNTENLIKDELIMCNMPHCGRAYHTTCLKYWPQSKLTLSKNVVVSLRCPSHVCHTCVSDDPKGKYQNVKDTNTTKCVKCPATYHMDSTCIPAGSQILTAAHIICPRHGLNKSDQNVNVSWCFICVRGGKLICCETCPTAVHAECSNVTLDSNENYICDECESGRMPLYGEMVWAKFNSFRWWPAIILPPTEVPLNIRSRPHNAFDFVIRFFGTHDHGWISRRRVYLYVEGDWSEPPRKRRLIDQSYLRGVLEAKEAYEIVKAKNIIRDSKKENKEKLQPQPYVKIRVNRAISPVKLHHDMEKVSKCDCKPNDENPCGIDSNCLNRVLYHECNPKICPAGERCQNQMFESRISPALDIFYAKKERGFGLRCRESISAGTFVIEYVGEVINSEEFQRRMEQKSADRDENYYFLHVEKDYIIDAGPRGNMARFMNHSCDPNCETQKWSVNGIDRVGLFAIKDIPANTELTFNYHWDELLGNDKKTCSCGSTNCTGLISKITKEEMKLKQENAVQERNLNLETPQLTKSSKSNKRRKNMQMKLNLRKKKDTHLLIKKGTNGIKKRRERKRVVKTKNETEKNDATTKSAEINDNNNNV